MPHDEQHIGMVLTPYEVSLVAYPGPGHHVYPLWSGGHTAETMIAQHGDAIWQLLRDRAGVAVTYPVLLSRYLRRSDVDAAWVHQALVRGDAATIAFITRCVREDDVALGGA